MNLLLKENNFDINRIILKESKKCIKLIYNLDYIYMLGLTIKLNNINYIENENFLFIELCNKDQITLLKNINNFIASKIKNYQSFFNGYYNIKVKKHNYYKKNENNTINITLNNLKKIKEDYKVQIFTI